MARSRFRRLFYREAGTPSARRHKKPLGGRFEFSMVEARGVNTKKVQKLAIREKLPIMSVTDKTQNAHDTSVLRFVFAI